MAINFYLDERRVNADGESFIRVSTSVRGVRMVTSLGFKLAADRWDKTKQRVRTGTTNTVGQNAAKMNRAIADVEKHLATFEEQCITRRIIPTTEMLRHEVQVALGCGEAAYTADGKRSFWSVFDEFTDDGKTSRSWTKPMVQKMAALRKKLKACDPHMTFESLDERGLNRFLVYIRDKCRLRNSTIEKQFDFFKTFLRWATRHGYNTNNTYEAYKPKLKTTQKQVVFLEWDELMRIFAFDVPPEGTMVPLVDCNGVPYEKVVRARAGMRLTRDIFLFCCFTSLRFSDALNLKRSDFRGNAFTITTIKTSDMVTIDLNRRARVILSSYADYKDPHGYVFPRITNQRMNIYIKEICELCGINTPITQVYYRGSTRHEETHPKFALIGTHTGRRTFICNSLMMGIPSEIVMKWTGHSDYKAMKPYIAIADAAKAKAMERWDDQ